ncbi:MAG: DUF2130 domain-containing protein [Candidatus Omnitrophota bacterium]
MESKKIKCPKCGEEIELNQAISQDIELRIKEKYNADLVSVQAEAVKQLQKREEEYKKQLEDNSKELTAKVRKEIGDSSRLEISDLQNQLNEKNNKLQEVEQSELEIRKRTREIEEKERNLDKMLEQKKSELEVQYKEGEKSLIAKATQEAQEKTGIEMKDLKQQLDDRGKKLEEARAQELALRKRQSELEDKEKSLEVEVARKIDEAKEIIRDTAQREIEQQHRLKDAEKDKQLAGMARTIDDLKRKAEQASQQTQGEVLELEIEDLLKSEFPFDEIEPVVKGIRGGDILQVVKTQSGRICGKIIWEAKRTKNWSDTWLQKLKDDQREAKADLAVLVSESLPKGFTHFRKISDVWVSDIPSSMSLALALRVVLIQSARAQAAQVGKTEKMEVVYNYLIGPEFKNRVEAIVEAFSSMKQALDSEKRAMQKIWSKREKQIERVIFNVAGMHGDLEGMVGSSLPPIKVLEIPADANSVKDEDALEI